MAPLSSPITQQPHWETHVLSPMSWGDEWHSRISIHCASKRAHACGPATQLGKPSNCGFHCLADKSAFVPAAKVNFSYQTPPPLKNPQKNKRSKPSQEWAHLLKLQWMPFLLSPAVLQHSSLEIRNLLPKLCCNELHQCKTQTLVWGRWEPFVSLDFFKKIH